VAGETVGRVSDARGELLIAEVVLGALLLLVTFAGSFVVGLRASAPIEQVRRRQAEFTADASHELRTPLSVIEAETDLALARPRDADEYRDTLQRIASESHRLRAIVDDLLWLARADGGDPHRSTTVVVDVGAVVSSAADRFRAVADADSIALTTRIGTPGSARVTGDPDGIDRLVTVLLDNACKYAGEGGAIDVSTGTTGGRVTLTVDDSGPGIPAEHRDLVFDRFHRAERGPGGTGLGLAIADAVVDATDGAWSVSTSPLGGARFEVTWRQAPRNDGPSIAREMPTTA
jgi:signal transduction histidine kinase